MLEVRLIGKFEIKYDGKPVVISSRAAQSLFAYLILTAGTSHRREKLAGMFWPDATEEKARAYLRHELWRIRKALSPKSHTDYLLADDLNISFNLSAESWLDVATLTNVSETTSIDELMKALSVFQGEFLPGFYDDWVTQEREHLQSVYEQKITRLLELLESKKCWSDILEWAERWISFGQSPEAAFRYLMFAYDALGDRAKVVSTYERCVQALRALDLEPSEQTRVLAFRRTSKLNIPIPLTSFIGREKELKEIADLLSKSRLVTLTGSGGVGKTRLAIQVVAEVLDRFPDGVWFLDLAPLSDPALIPQVVATTLGLIEQSGRSSIMILTNFLQTRQALLMLDNCEHLVQACAHMAETLLHACPNLHILATSREVLKASGEIPYRVSSLEILKPDIEFAIDELSKLESVWLFMERAAIVSPGFSLDSVNALDIAQICQRLDGIPLAIELAAARVNMLTIGQISKRLDNQLHLLTNGARTALPRHQTLRATIDWSHNLLSRQEQLLFGRLSVFAGGWILEAAESVCEGNGIETHDILDLLTQLFSKSLVVVEQREGQETRYRMLETIRQYAREKLSQGGEGELMRQRHLAYFVDLAERAEPNLRAFDMVMWLDRLEAELDNIRAALDWSLKGDVEASIRLASALLWLWWIRGYRLEGNRWLERALSIEAMERDSKPLLPARAMLRAQGCYVAGFLVEWWSPPMMEKDHATPLLEESLALFRELGSAGRRGMAYAIRGLGGMAFMLDDSGRARSLTEESLTLFRELGDKFGIAECIGHLGAIALKEGDVPQAAVRFEERLALSKEFGDKDGIANSLSYLAYLAAQQGDYRRAVSLSKESLVVARELGYKSTIAYQLENLAYFARAQSQVLRAVHLLGAAEALRESINSPLSTSAGVDEPTEHDHAITTARAALGEETFAAAWEEGNKMTLDEAVTYALEEQ